jgi:PAS domain S-box-containing protein
VPATAANRQTIAFGLVLAFALPAATMAIRLVVSPTEQAMLIVFVPAIMLSAAAGGLGPGLVATVVSCAGAAYYLLPPLDNFAVDGAEQRTNALLLFGVGAATSTLIGSLREARNRARASEAQTRAAETLYRTLFLHSPTGIAVADAGGRYIDANPAMCHLLGYSREELVAMGVADVVAPEELPYVETGLSGQRADRFGPRDWRLRRKDGVEINAEISAAPIPEGRVIATIRDITDQRMAQQALRDRDAAVEANRLKSQFLAHIGHELRTPLTAIIGFTGTLLMRLPGPLTGEQAQQLTTVQSSARHLLALIDDVLQVSTIDARGLDLHLEPVTVMSVIEEAVAILRPQAEAKGLTLTVQGPDGPPLTAWAERAALGQTLVNLVGNAIKFTARGEVRVEAHGVPIEGLPLVAIDVVDTGVGIEERDQSRLFERFAQVGPDTSGTDGVGLGLYLSRKLVEAQRGTLVVESVRGRGSRFTVTLEAVSSDAPADS